MIECPSTRASGGSISTARCTSLGMYSRMNSINDNAQGEDASIEGCARKSRPSTLLRLPIESSMAPSHPAPSGQFSFERSILVCAVQIRMDTWKYGRVYVAMAHEATTSGVPVHHSSDIITHECSCEHSSDRDVAHESAWLECTLLESTNCIDQVWRVALAAEELQGGQSDTYGSCWCWISPLDGWMSPSQIGL